MFFQNFVDLYGVFVIRYYEGEYSPLFFRLGVLQKKIFFNKCTKRPISMKKRFKI